MLRRYADFLNESESKEDDSEVPIVAVYGGFQVGKSTLLNSLLRSYSSIAGAGLATTFLVSRYRYGENVSIRFRTKPDSNDRGYLRNVSIEEMRLRDFKSKVDLQSGFHIESSIPAEILKNCQLVDTPGYNANESDSAVALNAMDHVDYALFVTSNFGLSQPEKELLLKLGRKRIPVSVVMNCQKGRAQGAWVPNHKINRRLAQECESWLLHANLDILPIASQRVFLCNCLFFWSQQEAFAQSFPDIDRPESICDHIHYSLEEFGLPNDSKTILDASRIPMLYEGLKNNLKKYNPSSRKFDRQQQ